jgi:hypothetical protein
MSQNCQDKCMPHNLISKETHVNMSKFRGTWGQNGECVRSCCMNYNIRTKLESFGSIPLCIHKILRIGKLFTTLYRAEEAPTPSLDHRPKNIS